jgi:putative nucleotidyltransferase with HDIG domain
MPTIELLHALDEDELSSLALAKGISKHQSLVVRMLRMANSSFYGMPGQVETIPEAMTVLGLRTVRTLVITMGLLNQFSAVSLPGFNLDNFWRHCIATALGASSLAQRIKQKEGIAFVAGLLHDVGRLVLASNFQTHFTAVLQYQAISKSSLLEAEQFILGMNHADIGRLLGERWHFPPAICEAIASHHHPDNSGSHSLADITHLADVLAHTRDLAADSTETFPSLSQSSLRRVNLSWQDSQDAFAEIEQEFDVLCKAQLS